MTTYTFIWPANGLNPLGLFVQVWSGTADTVTQAWEAMLSTSAGHDWAPQQGDPVLVLVGDFHEVKWHRVIPIKVPLGLTDTHFSGREQNALERWALKATQGAPAASPIPGTVAAGLEKMAKALENNTVDGQLLCRRCDIFVGFAAAGHAMPPATTVTGSDRTAWLDDHCWLCHRSRDEIIEAYMQSMEKEIED